MMKSASIPGAVVTVVLDGRVALAKGYGLADVERATPVDPHRTLFGIASVSKTFTALTALRLAEEGKLDLSRDIDDYLGEWKPRRVFDGPITLAQLLTHTAGFDDEEIGDAARRADEVEPLAAYLARRMPPQIQAPGTVVKYSNHGTALVGLLVERAAGVPFDEAVRAQVLEPLGMMHSSFAQPLSAELESRRAVAYGLKGGRAVPIARYYARPFPAWGMSTTGEDMGRFLVAALDSVSRQPFTPPVRARWAAAAYRAHPSLPGVTMGMFEGETNGRRYLYHEGGMEGFTSYLLVMPGEGFGLFVAQNRRTGDLRRALQTALVNRLFPLDSSQAATAFAADSTQGAAVAPVDVSGRYRFNRDYYPHNLMKMLSLVGVGTEWRVSMTPTGVVVDGDRAVRVSPSLFRWQGGQGRVAFTNAAPGVPAAMTLSTVPLAAYTRISWEESASTHRILLGTASVLFLASLALDVRGTGAGDGQTARQLGAAMSATHVVFMGGLAGALALQSSQLQFGVPGSIKVLLALPVANIGLTAAHAFYSAKAARGADGLSDKWSTQTTFRQAALSAASITTLISLHHWNLLGWHF